MITIMMFIYKKIGQLRLITVGWDEKTMRDSDLY